MNHALRWWLRSLMVIEACCGVLGLLLLCLQGSGAIALSPEVLLFPFWSIGALRGLWTAFTGLLACSLVLQGWSVRRDRQWNVLTPQPRRRRSRDRRRKGRR